MDYTSGGVIAALVILNVATGTSNEWKAEKVRIVFRKCPYCLLDYLCDRLLQLWKASEVR